MIGELLKKIIAGEIAEWIHLVKEDLKKLDENSKHHPGDESTVALTTDFGRPELLDDTIVAGVPRTFGFTIH